MSDPNEAPGDNLHKTARPSALVTAAAMAAGAWLFLVIGASALGAAMSLFTGKVEELPKWNGFDYLMFCAKEGAMLGGVCAVPLVVVTFIVGWVTSTTSRRRS